MRTTWQFGFTGWTITGVLAAALGFMVAAAFAIAPDPVDGARLVIRLTARTSLTLFLLAFTASALVRWFPSPFTRWLRTNRRYIGVSFAVSHFLHLAAIITLARLDPALFLHLTNIVAYVGGGLAYVFIILMTITSFDRTSGLIGPRIWIMLHMAGAWYIWVSFALNFGKRIPGNALYLIPVAFIFAAAVLWLFASLKTNTATHSA